MPSGILTAVEKFEHAGAVCQVAVEGGGQSGGFGEGGDRDSQCGTDLDQSGT